MRTVLGRRRGCRRGLLHPVDLLDEQKDREGDDQKIQNIVKEDAVIQRRRARRFGRGNTRIVFARKVNEQIREIDSAQRQSDRRHQDVLDERGDNLAERGADHHAHGQVDNVASHDKFFELVVHAPSRKWSQNPTISAPQSPSHARGTRRR